MVLKANSAGLVQTRAKAINQMDDKDSDRTEIRRLWDAERKSAAHAKNKIE